MLTAHPAGNGGLVNAESDGSLGLCIEVINQPVKKRVHGHSPYGYSPNHRYGYSPLQAYGRSPNNSGMELKDRLKQARKHRKMSQARLSEATGLDQTTISNLETGKVLSTSKLVQIADALDVDARWLATGAGSMLDAAISPDAELIDTEIIEGNEPLRADEVLLPLLREVEFSAGQGATQIIENHGAQERFSLPRLARAGVQPQNAALAVARGDSMMPAIHDGATLGIDKGCRSVIDGKIFVLDHGGMLRVKRLYRLPLNRLRVVSDNSVEYPEETYSLSDPDAPKVLGRVFWWENFD
ncbi:MAG: helix-turn-helix transcriptional regulator [Halomonas sp.]|nr:helix-turn-helix transcriptional regulator [Halomonas sp.]